MRKGKSRKTIEVNALKEYINNKLANPDISELEKKALCSLIGHILLETNNYRGFNYLYWLNIGHKKWVESGNSTDSQVNYVTNNGDNEYSRIYY